MNVEEVPISWKAAKTLTPEVTRTKTQTDKKWLSD